MVSSLTYLFDHQAVLEAEFRQSDFHQFNVKASSFAADFVDFTNHHAEPSAKLDLLDFTSSGTFITDQLTS